MPRPKKIVPVVEENMIEDLDVSVVDEIEVFETQLTIDLNSEKKFEEIIENVVEQFDIVEPPPAPETPSVLPVKYDVFENNVFVKTVENTEELDFYLEINKVQLLDFIEELKKDTFNEEDLALFNTPDDNRTYKNLAQYFLQNGLAPVEPKIKSWMVFYTKKYPFMSEEEIAIKAIGNLRYSFSIAQ
jgi:hypothetical protein